MAFDKGRERSDEISMASVLGDLASAIRAIKESGDDTAKQLALQHADLLVRQMPENKMHPGKSAYSYPEGEAARPKAPLKCEMFWVGYPMTPDTLLPAEIDALNAAQPGVYRVTKANGNQIPFTVEGKQNVGGKLEQLWFNFPCKGDQSTDHGSMLSYLQQAQGIKLPSLAELQAEIARLRGDLQTAQAVIAAA